VDTLEKLEWSALEYEDIYRSKDWFWALGIIIVAGSLASIIFGNYFFAVLIILSGVLLGFFATKQPETILYELNDKGLKIKTNLFPYENIKSFWVQVGQDHKEKNLKPILFIHSERVFMPILTIPIVEGMGGEIREIFLAKDIQEEEMKEHLSEKIMDVLGF